MKNQKNLSQLPIKLLFLSYLNHYQIKNTLNDCHSAINTTIDKLSNNVQLNYQEIVEIVGIDIINTTNNNKAYSLNNNNQKTHLNLNANKMMDIIYQEDHLNISQRSNQYDQELFKSGKKQTQANLPNNYQNFSNIATKFNLSINNLENVNTKFQDIMFMYKKQLKDLAKDLTKQRQLNKKLCNQIKQLNISMNKPPRTTSLSKISNKNLISQPQVSQTMGTVQQQNSQNTTRGNKSRSMSTTNKQKNEQDFEQVRCPPKPFCQECIKNQNKQNSRRQENLAQKAKWRQLSTKITNLKLQLTSYEEQLIQKQTQIKKLTDQLNKIKIQQVTKETDQKKKIKSMNTTLRGQKIVLQNQIVNLKKKSQEFQQLIQTLQSQNKKISFQKQNLQSTIKWHLNTIQDLRDNFSKGIKQDSQLVKKLSESQKLNKLLYEKINEQEKYSQDFMIKLMEIQKRNNEQIQKLKKKNQELECIIEQKNETIIKIKMNMKSDINQINQNNINNLSMTGLLTKVNNGSAQLQISEIQKQHKIKQNSQISIPYGTIMTKTMKKQLLNQTINSTSGFQSDMIRVLNKKLGQKQIIIQRLQNQNKELKNQIDLLMENSNKKYQLNNRIQKIQRRNQFI